MSTTSRPRMKSQAVIDKCQVEIVDLKGTYLRSAGIKSAAILDGTELCRVEEFAARHFRRSGFEATFLERDLIRVATLARNRKSCTGVAATKGTSPWLRA
jgi:hypothetical protein